MCDYHHGLHCISKYPNFLSFQLTIVCLFLQENDDTSQTKLKDFLAILLTAKDDNGIGMTPLEIRNEVDTFLFEGL